MSTPAASVSSGSYGHRRGLSPYPGDVAAASIDAMSARVLIVDDHAPFRALARRLLIDDGFDVVGEAADGATAIDAARALRPDVVLLDVQLPDVDGFRVAQALAGASPTPAVVLVSS